MQRSFKFSLVFFLSLFLKSKQQERDGWYTTHAFEQIKTVLRHKFFSLLEGHPASDDDCLALLAASDGSAKAATAHRSSKLRPGRHNMAKGALRPEDAAVSSSPGRSSEKVFSDEPFEKALRLRATLDRNIKQFHTQHS